MSMFSTAEAHRNTVNVGILQVVPAAFKRWWLARMMRRLENLAILRLQTMSDRELRDIGIVRSQIEFAVRSDHERDRRSAAIAERSRAREAHVS